MFRYDSFAGFAVDEVAMQRAQESPPARAPEPSSPRLFSPLRVFVVLALVLVALSALVLLTRPANEVAEEPPPTTDTSFALTDTEAIARFKELHALFRKASMERDPTLIRLIFSSDSPNLDRAVEDIRQLRNDRVLDRSVFEIRSLLVDSNETDEITIEQEVLIQPRFVAENTGSDITSGTPTLDTIRWVLHLEDGVWKVFEARVTDSQPRKL